MNLKSNAFVLCLFTLIMMLTVGMTAYADSDGSGTGSLGKKIAGAYLVREGDDPTFLRLITLTADGNWLSTESHQQSVEFGFSDQQGVWKKSGRREITANVIDFHIDPMTGEPTGVARIRFVITFSKDFQGVSGEFVGKEFAFDQDPLDPNVILDDFGATLTGRRVTVQVD